MIKVLLVVAVLTLLVLSGALSAPVYAKHHSDSTKSLDSNQTNPQPKPLPPSTTPNQTIPLPPPNKTNPAIPIPASPQPPSKPLNGIIVTDESHDRRTLTNLTKPSLHSVIDFSLYPGLLLSSGLHIV